VPSLQPGDEFAGYRILRRLGAGGMGTVYLAEHPRLPRRDAIKVLDPRLAREPGFRARFEREAELAARLEHPNVVAVYDRGEEGDLLWIAMRYVDGVDAGELVRRGRSELPPARAVRIVAAAARGLDAAHRRGLLHRDVKPANIMVARADDGSDSVRLADFGIARPLGIADTTTNSVLASFAYAAPELFTGAPLDHRSDVYALGCTLYEMLTGSAPFVRPSHAAAMHAHLYERPPVPSHTDPALAPFDPVIARALAKVPAQRYESCGALAEAALAAVDAPRADPGPTPGHPPAATPPTTSPSAPPAPTGHTPAQGISTAPAAGGPGTAPHGLTSSPGNRGTYVTTPAARTARALLIAGCVVLLLLSAAIAAVLVRENGGRPTAGPGTTVTSAAGTTARSTEAPSTTVAPVSSAWGPAAYIVEAFPDLLPAEPTGTGYQGMRCALNDDLGEWLHCPAASDDGIHVNIHCDPTRGPLGYRSDVTGLTGVREERWTRPSGTGKVRWGSDSIAGFGLLDVSFDDPDRSFCVVSASGGAGGRDVYDRWWRSAPI